MEAVFYEEELHQVLEDGILVRSDLKLKVVNVKIKKSDLVIINSTIKFMIIYRNIIINAVINLL